MTPNPDKRPIALSIGEPKHTSPAFVAEALSNNLDQMAVYPTTLGIPALREAIGAWCERRFNVPKGWLDPARNILPVNGTREALFAFTQTVVNRGDDALVVSPNPFYQIYEGAALLAGAKPHYLPCLDSNGFNPDFDAVSPDIWKRCQILFLCSPGNPTGALIPVHTLKNSSPWPTNTISSSPPTSATASCTSTSKPRHQACSAPASSWAAKTSSVAWYSTACPSAPTCQGCAQALWLAMPRSSRPLLYRTYHGCAMPVQTQLASIAAWQDEAHVLANRDLYREKFDAVLAILKPVLDVQSPDGGFYLWPNVQGDDAAFCRDLFVQEHVTVVPGSYLSREVDGFNPGAGRVRLALVAPLAECVEAAERIRDFIQRRR